MLLDSTPAKHRYIVRYLSSPKESYGLCLSSWKVTYKPLKLSDKNDWLFMMGPMDHI